MKLFLNLSKEEQRTRFLRRIDLPDHNWKFSAADVKERELLGRLPEGVLRDALEHEHRACALVRDPRRPQVVRADLRGGRHRERADQDRSAVPQGGARGARRAQETKGLLEAEAPDGAEPDPFEAEELAKAAKAEGKDGKKAKKKSGKKAKKSK